MAENSDPWQLRNFNCVSNVGEAPALAKLNTNPVLFPTYADPSGCFHLNSSFLPPLNQTRLSPGRKRFMIFDQSGDKTSMIYRPLTTQFMWPDSAEAKTNVSNGNASEEMHEDTEEIDALLYSNTDHHAYEEEDETSTGHSPIDTGMSNLDNEEAEQLASSAAMQPLPSLPTKRRRFELRLDPSLEDTASSTHCGNEDRKKAKREKIQETVRVLRRIIPGGKGKDAASVLDEAIKYLRSLRLKAKGLGVVSTLK